MYDVKIMSFEVLCEIWCDLLVEQFVLDEPKLTDMELAQLDLDKVWLGQNSFRQPRMGNGSYWTREVHQLELRKVNICFYEFHYHYYS